MSSTNIFTFMISWLLTAAIFPTVAGWFGIEIAVGYATLVGLFAVLTLVTTGILIAVFIVVAAIAFTLAAMFS